MNATSQAVFISYASQDAEAAGRICEALRTAGIEVWFDQSELRGGEAWDRQIRRQIHDCRLFVAIISAHTEARHEGYFRREWRLAVERTADMAEDVPFLLPVVIDDTRDATARVPDRFREFQWAHAPDGRVPAAFVEQVQSLLVEPPSRASTGSISPSARRVQRDAPSRTKRRSLILGAPVAAVVVVGVAYVAIERSGFLRRGPVPQLTMAVRTTTPAATKSIAVLPFIDLSEKHDQEYFSDGLTEELIDRLAGAPGLKVIARTSSFEFKGKNEDVRSIARKLDVANLLEGSVRRSGQSLRVTAQLIRAADGTHLWSHSYDEYVSDIFKVQEAIAEKVARELESALDSGPAERAQTTNLQAYDAVQKGTYLRRRSETGDDDKALALFQEATRLDPGYALAWEKVAGVYFFKGYMGVLAMADARSQALSAIQRALAIDPNLAQAHALLGSIYRDFDWNWRAAKDEFDTAARLDPNGGYGADAGYLNWILTGDISSEIASLQQDLVRDPLRTGTLFGLGISYWAGRRYAESADTYVRLLELNPRYSGVASLYAQSLLFMGQYENALATALSDPDKSSQLGVLPCIYWKLGRTAESDTALRELERDAAKRADNVAEMTACRGETDQVFVWLERAYRERQAGLQNVKFDPYLLSLHQDRRFQALLRKMNLSE